MNLKLLLLAGWNLLVFLVYGLDKSKAKRGKWRIPEKTLMLLALFFGGVGAFCGMKVFHHKTQKPLFKFGVPACLVINAAALYFLYTKGLI